MLTFEDLAQWAGPEGVVQAKADAAGAWAVTDDEKQVLVEAGLPRFVGPFFEARIQTNRAPTIESRSADGLYQVGFDMGRNIGVASAGRGVYVVDPERELPELFVNSSAVALAEFLHHVVRLRQEYPRMNGEQIDASLANLKARLVKIDESAFSNSARWLSQVFEQMELGMY